MYSNNKHDDIFFKMDEFFKSKFQIQQIKQTENNRARVLKMK